MSQRDRVLVVDDEADTREVLDSALSYAGYEVRVAADGRAAIAAVERAEPDVLVLDVVLPVLDGIDLVRLLRDHGDTVPVLFLSARAGLDDRIAGLRAGGDDYLTKPFSVVEVIARVDALVRRSRYPRGRLGTTGTDRVAAHDVELDRARHTVRSAGVEVDLSPTEFRLLDLLMSNAGFLVSKGQILDRIWGYEFGGDTNIVERVVSNLRHKLGDAGAAGAVETVRGFGYRFAADVD